MPYIEDSLKKFNTLPPEVIVTVDSDFVSKELEKIEAQYGVVLSSLLIQVTVGDVLMEGIENYLEVEFGLDGLTSKAINEDLQKNIFGPLIRRLDYINPNPEKGIALKEEMFYTLEIFTKGLCREFEENPIINAAVNARIFYIISQNLAVKDDLEKALLTNQELLTDKDFLLEGKKAQPTIENWLLDFMKSYGTGIFDQLVLTEYVIKNRNCRVLLEDEKKRLKKLLLLYRNLKFFPLSMPSDNTDEWEIFPIEKPVGETGKDPLGIPKTQDEKEIDRILIEKQNYDQASLQQAALDEEIGRKRRLEDLRIEAEKYREGSLERRVLEEEIFKLEK